MYFTRYEIDPLKDLKSEDIERFFDMFGKIIKHYYSSKE